MVSLNYSKKNSEGLLIDTSEGREPLVCFHGVDGLIPGVKTALEGSCIGDGLSVIMHLKMLTLKDQGNRLNTGADALIYLFYNKCDLIHWTSSSKAPAVQSYIAQSEKEFLL